MRDIGENHFNSFIKPCLNMDRPCSSFEQILESSQNSPIFESSQIHPTPPNDPSLGMRKYVLISHNIPSGSEYSSLISPIESTFPSTIAGGFKCIVCEAPCTDVHRCPGCHCSIHAICGHPVEGMEGYGCPVWCVSCWLEERSITLQEGRRAAKRGQDQQINRIHQQSMKRSKIIDIGENVLLSIPQVDKRSPFEPQNLPGVVLNRTDR